MNSSYCLNMSLCNNHENNETNISFYTILLNACAKGTCSLYRVGPVGGNYFGSIFSTTQNICISNFRSLSLIVNILWHFEKYILMNVTTFVSTL